MFPRLVCAFISPIRTRTQVKIVEQMLFETHVVRNYYSSSSSQHWFYGAIVSEDHLSFHRTSFFFLEPSPFALPSLEHNNNNNYISIKSEMSFIFKFLWNYIKLTTNLFLLNLVISIKNNFFSKLRILMRFFDDLLRFLIILCSLAKH